MCFAGEGRAKFGSGCLLPALACELRFPALARLVGDLVEQVVGHREGSPRREPFEGGGGVLRPGAVGAHGRRHLRGGVGDEGGGERRVDGDQIEREPHDPGCGVGVLLEHRPGGCVLEVFVACRPDRPQRSRGFAHFHRVHELFVFRDPGGEIGDQRLFGRTERAARRDLFAVLRAAELGDPADKISQHIGEILVDRHLEVFPGELAVGVFRRMAQEPPPPVIRRQDLERLVHEHAASLRGGELAALVVEVVERLDVVDELPGLTGPHQGGGEGERVEGHVVLAHELDVAHVARTLVGAPPAFPVGVGLAVGLGPFGGGGDVFDRRVEPDVEDLALHAGPVFGRLCGPGCPSRGRG